LVVKVEDRFNARLAVELLKGLVKLDPVASVGIRGKADQRADLLEVVTALRVILCVVVGMTQLMELAEGFFSFESGLSH
jgi:hypothetical protein